MLKIIESELIPIEDIKFPYKSLTKKISKLFCNIMNLEQINIEVNLAHANDEEIIIYNKKFRNKSTATNILSFPFYEEVTPINYEKKLLQLFKLEDPIYLGDIILSHETLIQEVQDDLINVKNIGKEKYNNLELHYMHLLTHSLLHLLNFDHLDDKDAIIMNFFEAKILAQLNIMHLDV